jgi:hypothetical protein
MKNPHKEIGKGGRALKSGFATSLACIVGRRESLHH